MTAKLIDGSLDVAIALTEGLLAGIAKGHDAYKIIGTYVESPLCKRRKKEKSAGINTHTPIVRSVHDD